MIDDAQPPELAGKADDHPSDTTQPRAGPTSTTLKTMVAQNLPLAMVMFKGSLPMTIILAMYQSTVVATRYTTLGYIIAIAAFFSNAMLPRAKYLESLAFNTLGVCIGSALSLLVIWCGIKAREHTTAPGSTEVYNSSQAAVCAIWFFFTQWVAGTVRAKIPLLQVAVFHFSVLTMIAMTYAPRFATIDQGIAVVVELLEVFLIGFAVATGVSLFVFPMTTRTILFKKQAAYFGALRGFVKKQTAYHRALETRASSSLQTANGEIAEKDGEPTLVSPQTAPFPEREALYAGLSDILVIHTEVYNDTVYAKQEMAYGKLNGGDLGQLFKAFREILTQVVGIRTIIGMFDLMTPGTSSSEQSGKSVEVTAQENSEFQLLWSKVMLAMDDPFAEISDVIDQGLEHAAVVLEYLPEPTSNDVEALGDLKPGDPTFAEYMDQKIQAFHFRRAEFLSAWERERDALRKDPTGIQTNPANQQNLYNILHVENLIYSLAVAVYKLVLFADMKARDGTMAKKRLIYPSLHKVAHLLRNTLSGNPDLRVNGAGEHLDGNERGFTAKTSMQSGARDPQHLPPRNAWERYSNYLRAVPRLLRSKESSFGLRLALAALSIGILAYLEKTWTFYYQQKLIWTLIAILVSTNMSSGESTFRLAGRAIGTVAATVISYIAWYIVDGRPAGVLVFTWLAFLALSYGFAKIPQLFNVWLCTAVTLIAIIGSALQSNKLGHEAIIASGQIDYPIYLTAPYRLATVLTGCVVAYFWTLFPYPITDRSLLSEKLGDLLFLLAKFHDCGHSIASLKMRGKEGDMALKASPGRKLMKVQNRLFHEMMTLIPQLRSHALFQGFEFPIGGRFPATRYMSIMTEMTNIMSYINVVIHSTPNWPTTLFPSSPTSDSPVSQDTAVLFAAMAENSHHLTSAITLLSAAVKYGIPLPPYFKAPPTVDFSPLWDRLSADIQQEQGRDPGRHEEAVYSAWAVLHIVGDMVNSALGRMVVEVRELVGEVDFESAIIE